MHPIAVFLIAGAFAMSGAISASKLLKLPPEGRPDWSQGSGQTRVLIAGNLCALILVAAMVYGFIHINWWVSLGCLFITFPVIHVLIMERLLGYARGLIAGTVGALVGAALLGVFW